MVCWFAGLLCAAVWYLCCSLCRFSVVNALIASGFGFVAVGWCFGWRFGFPMLGGLIAGISLLFWLCVA